MKLDKKTRRRIRHARGRRVEKAARDAARRKRVRLGQLVALAIGGALAPR